MDEFKIRIFNEENPDSIIEISSIIAANQEFVLNELLQATNLSNVVLSHTFFESILKALPYKIDVHSTEDPSLIKKIIESDGPLFPEEPVSIIWDFSIPIDEASFIELINRWDYIWYPDSDEAVILFIIKRNLIFLITHYNAVYTNIKPNAAFLQNNKLQCFNLKT